MPINIETLESNTRLSESFIWTLQKEALKTHANSHLEESQAMTRSSLSDVYSEFLFSFLLDYREKLDLEAPLYILELGAQSGTFSYKVFQSLKEKIADFARLRDLKICYLMSDWQASRFESCRQNPLFQEPIERGEIDFVLIEEPEVPTVELMVQGKTLQGGDFKNPLVVLSRHFFEKTRQEAFSIRNHECFLRPYTFFRDSNLYPHDTKTELAQLRFARGEFKSQRQKYEEAHFEEILSQYQQIFADAAIIFPVAALRFIKCLNESTSRNLVLFVADKGHSDPGCFQFKTAAHKYQIHENLITFDVNFDAIKRYVEALGGKSLVFAGDKHHLVSAAFFLLASEPVLEHCHHFWHQNLAVKDPINTSLIVEQLLRQFLSRESAQFISDAEERFSIFLALVRQGNYEPDIFVHAYETLLPKEGVEFAEFEAVRRMDIVLSLRRVFANIVRPEMNLSALEKLSDLFLLMGSFDDCIKVCNLANQVFGPQTHFFDRLAMSYRGQKEFAKAGQILENCQKLFPHHPWPSMEMESLQEDRQKHEAQAGGTSR